MADIAVTRNPMKVVAADTNENILVFDNVALQRMSTKPQTLLFLEVKTGSFKFSAGLAISGAADEVLYSEGDKVAISVTDADRLRFKATASSDVFNVSF